MEERTNSFEDEVVSTFMLTFKLAHQSCAAWHMLFDCTWRGFQHRFDGILSDLRRHSDLLDREAASIHFAQAKEQSDIAQRQFDEIERQRKRMELREIQQWLNVNSEQEARLSRLAKRCQPGSCEWMFGNDSIKSWELINRNTPVIWIKGNPGSGKPLLFLVVGYSSLLNGVIRQKRSLFTIDRTSSGAE